MPTLEKNKTKKRKPPAMINDSFLILWRYAYFSRKDWKFKWNSFEFIILFKIKKSRSLIPYNPFLFKYLPKKKKSIKLGFTPKYSKKFHFLVHFQYLILGMRNCEEILKYPSKKEMKNIK